MSSPDRRRTLTVITGVLVLAIVATLPLSSSPIGHPDVDVANHAWGPWWWWSTLGRGQIPWSTTLLAAPKGGVLWFIDPFTAAVGAPFVGILGAASAYNLAIVLALALGAAGGRALARALGADERVSWIAAIVVVFSPYVLSEVHNGVSEAANVAWSTFALAAARRAIDSGRDEHWRRRWVITGLWLGLAAMGTWYYGLTTGVTIGTWALLELGGRWRPWAARWARARDPLRGAALAGGVGVAFAAPALALVYLSITDARSLVVRGAIDAPVRELLLAHNAVDPRAFFAPGGFQSVDLAAGGEAFVHSSYLGLLALALALVALRERPPLGRVALGVVPSAVLSLGAYLSWGGDWVRVGGHRVVLPFAWLLTLLPDAGSTHAQRLVWPALAVVGALAAVGAGRLAAGGLARLAGISALVAADLLWSAPWPIARGAPLDMRAHERLAGIARAERQAGTLLADGVLDLPAEVGATMATSAYLLYQTASGLPLPYRPDARGGTAAVLGIQAFNLLFLPSATRGDATQIAAKLAGFRGIDIGSLETRGGIRWIILHRELERGRGDVAQIETQLRQWFGEPNELGTHLTWDVHARTDDGGAVTIGAPKGP